MREQPNRRRGPRRADDPERALVVALRWAVIPTICLPLAIASVGASVTGGGLSAALALQLAALALIANAGCWVKVIGLWRALPRPDDDDQDWRRRWDSDSPLDPGCGPGGITVDWARFERDFWSHVEQQQRQRENELIHALALAPACVQGALDCLLIAQRSAHDAAPGRVGIFTTPLSFLAKAFTVTRRIPFHTSINDCLPQYYIDTLTPKRGSSVRLAREPAPTAPPPGTQPLDHRCSNCTTTLMSSGRRSSARSNSSGATREVIRPLSQALSARASAFAAR
jgi:hypothetical protein